MNAKPLLTLGILGGIGYLFYKSMGEAKAASSTSVPQGTTPTPKKEAPTPALPTGTPPVVLSPGDLVPIPIPGVPGFPGMPGGNMPGGGGGSSWPTFPGVPVDWSTGTDLSSWFPGGGGGGGGGGTPGGGETLPCNETFVRSGNLDQDLDALAAQCAPNYQANPAVKKHRRTFNPGEQVRIPFQPSADVNYRVFAIGDEGLQDVNVWIVEPVSGEVLFADMKADTTSPSIGFNVKKAGAKLELVVEASKGFGEVAYGLYTEIPCWKGVVLGDDAVANLHELASRCCKGMQQVIPDIVVSFKQGEERTIPVFIPAGTYRAIAVGGQGVMDADLVLKDRNGKIVAADVTSDDAMPMLHPRKNFVVAKDDQFSLTIKCVKGSGQIAGGVWKAS